MSGFSFFFLDAKSKNETNAIVQLAPYKRDLFT